MASPPEAPPPGGGATRPPTAELRLRWGGADEPGGGSTPIVVGPGMLFHQVDGVSDVRRLTENNQKVLIAIGLMTGLQTEIRTRILGATAHVSIFQGRGDPFAGSGRQPELRARSSLRCRSQQMSWAANTGPSWQQVALRQPSTPPLRTGTTQPLQTP